MRVKNTDLGMSDIVTAYITFVNGKGGKRRPALIVAETSDKFAINNSKQVQEF
ncbi:hypothetical protein [Lactobacillus sp. ESL0681]|uniref:hypothetical protein n=1 Tax=Lactobacillus sp. ESL0681 TaxID=2983211 RepID=UPI0023F7513E|nr:hypothetical protein [Lactobacillus sp. ESL0681]WEV40971.1 hypothetical protein OZX59_03365 [Lactobacillus sp. ESL0681]